MNTFAVGLKFDLNKNLSKAKNPDEALRSISFQKAFRNALAFKLQKFKDRNYDSEDDANEKTNKSKALNN